VIVRTGRPRERPLAVVIPSYGNRAWLSRTLASVLEQDYGNYRVFYTDDGSADGSAEAARQFLADHPARGRVTFIENDRRRGAMANLYAMIHRCRDEEIVLTLDGDDWLAHEGVMQRINEVYQDEDVWLTWGQYRSFPDDAPGCADAIPAEIVEANAYREYLWCSSHLRTFRAWLFKRIEKADLMVEGQWAPMAWDLAMMFAMLEMSGPRTRFIGDVLYVYNTQNPLSDDKVDRPLQQRLERHFRSGRRYERLEAAAYARPSSSMPGKK